MVPKETWSVRDETMLAGSLRIAFQAQLCGGVTCQSLVAVKMCPHYGLLEG